MSLIENLNNVYMRLMKIVTIKIEAMIQETLSLVDELSIEDISVSRNDV